MKPCRTCKQVKTLSEFYRTGRTRQGYKPDCKACYCAYTTENRRLKKLAVSNIRVVRGTDPVFNANEIPY